MSVRRPLKSLSAAVLKEMTDGELDRLAYEVRKAYAAVLTAAGKGHINVGGSGTNIGSTVDSKRTPTSTTGDGGFTGDAGDAGYHTGGDWPAPGSTGVNTNVTTYTYYQNRTIGGTPFASTAHIDLYSYYVYGGTAGEVILEGVEANIVDTIISACITDMATGDEVGTYRITTGSAPTNGGAGTWVNKGTFFVDTLHSATQNTYKYWLKTDLTTPPAETKPIGRSGTAMKELSVAHDGDLVQKILLPALQNRHDNSQLNYHVQTSIPGGYTAKGTFLDTRYGSSTVSYTGPSGDTYTTTITPSGTPTAHSTYYLNLQT